MQDWAKMKNRGERQNTRTKMQISVVWLVMEGLAIHLALPSDISRTCKTEAKMKTWAEVRNREADEEQGWDAAQIPGVTITCSQLHHYSDTAGRLCFSLDSTTY